MAKSKRAWFAMHCVGALAFVGEQASAQDSPADAGEDESWASVATRERASYIDTITVTAQRRQENQQDVPVSVTALTGDSLERLGASNPEDLQNVVPGLIFSQVLNSSNVVLRGVGTDDSSGANEAAIGHYIDGVYYSTPSSLLSSLSDVERIEVLRGPQGTLFGRNSTGGAVQVVTRKPSYDWQGEAKFGYGNFETVAGDVFVAGGVTDKIAFSLSGAIRRQSDGWGRNLVNGEDTGIADEEAVRGKILFEPGPNTTLTLTADYVRVESDRDMQRNFPPPSAVSDGSLLFGLDGVTAFTGNIYDSPSDNSYFKEEDDFVEDWGVSLRVEQSLGFADLVSITSYRENDNLFNIDQDGTPAPIVGAPISQFADTFTQELQLLSNEDPPFQWVIGAFYMDRGAGNDPFRLIIGPNATILDRINEQKTQSIAGYAQATIGILDRLDLTLGGRYTSDDVEFTATEILQPAGIVTVPETTTSRSFSKPTWRAALGYELGDNVLVYVSHNRGFKGGTFNSNNPTPTAASPETIDALETGIKADLWSNRLRVNASAYFYDYEDLQVQFVVSGVANTINASKAKIKGLEIETTLIPIDGLTLTAGASVSVDSEYDEFRPSATSPGCPSNVILPGGGFDTAFVDCSGTGVIRIPDFTIHTSAAYSFDLGGLGSVDLSANYYYNDGYKYTVDNLIIQPNYHVLNARGTWTHNDGHLSVSLWAKNMLEEEYFLTAGSSGLGPYTSAAPPRTYGVSVGYNF